MTGFNLQHTRLPGALTHGVLLLLFAEWIGTSLLTLFCFGKVWLGSKSRLKSSVTLATGSALVLAKLLSVWLVVQTKRYAKWEGWVAPIGTSKEIDGAYWLHIWQNAQCCVLVVQAMLCLAETKRASIHMLARRVVYVASRLSPRRCLRLLKRTRTNSIVPGLIPSSSREKQDASALSILPISEKHISQPPVVVIIPSYHEDPQAVRDTLNSIASSIYPSSSIHIYLSFDGLNQEAEIRDVATFLGIPYIPPSKLDSELSLKASLNGCHVTISTFEHGGKLHCQRRTFEQISLAQDIPNLQSSYVLFLDSDTIVRPDCISNFVTSMQQSQSPGSTTTSHAMSGCIRVANPHSSLLHTFQKLDYFYTQVFERSAEAACGAVFCLPGGLTMINFTTLSSVADEYFQNTSTAPTCTFDHMVKLGEDRYLTQLLINRDPGFRGIGFCNDAVCDTIAPATIAGFFRQRKRWYLGYLANDIDGMCNPCAWRNFPLLSAFRCLYYVVGTPGLPLVMLTSWHPLRGTPYYATSLMVWAASLALTWLTTMVVARDRDDFIAALLYPVYLVVQPLQLVVTHVYSIATLSSQGWGSRTAPVASSTAGRCEVDKTIPTTKCHLYSNAPPVLVAELAMC